MFSNKIGIKGINAFVEAQMIQRRFVEDEVGMLHFCALSILEYYDFQGYGAQSIMYQFQG